MQVLLDARIGRKPTGIGNYISHLATELAKLSPADARPLVRPQHVARFARLGTRPIVALRGKRRLPRFDPDVVHGPNFHVDGLNGSAAVATIHDLGYLTLPECHPAGMPERLDRLVRDSLPRTALHLCLSAHTRDSFIDAYDAEPARCLVVPMGVDAEAFTPNGAPGETDALQRRFGLGRPYVLHVGAMVPRKDLLTLIQAFDGIADEKPDLELVLVGNKTLRWASDWPRVDAWLTAHPARRARVRVLDYVPARVLPAIYRQAAVVATTSLLEGFGMTLLEGFASGTPVVASRAGALPEVGGEAAYYGEVRNADSFSAALRAALAGEGRDRRQRAAARIVECHRWSRTAELSWAAYAAALTV